MIKLFPFIEIIRIINELEWVQWLERFMVNNRNGNYLSSRDRNLFSTIFSRVSKFLSFFIISYYGNRDGNDRFRISMLFFPKTNHASTRFTYEHHESPDHWLSTVNKPLYRDLRFTDSRSLPPRMISSHKQIPTKLKLFHLN